MKRKILQSIAFTLLIVTTFLFLNKRYVSSDYYRNINNLFIYESMPDDSYEIIVLGSSHAKHSVGYNLFPGYSTFTFASPGHTPYYYEQLLKAYQSSLRDDCVVLIGVSYFTPWRPLDYWQDNMKSDYYRLLPTKVIVGHNAKDAFLYKHFPVLSSKHHLFEIFSPVNNQLVASARKGRLNQEDFEKSVESNASYHSNAWLEVDGAVCEPQMEALANIVDMCYQNGWIPVLFTSPLSAEYLDVFPEAVHQDYYRVMDDYLLNKYPELLYLDYSSDDRFTGHREYFYDADHMNEVGRAAFTSVVLEDLQAAEYLPAPQR